MTTVADKTAEERVQLSDEARALRGVLRGGETRIAAEPLGNRVIIRQDPASERTDVAPSLIVAEAFQEKPSRGEVVAVGPECRVLCVGDRVLYAKYVGAEFELDGDALLALKETEVLLRLKPKLT